MVVTRTKWSTLKSCPLFTPTRPAPREEALSPTSRVSYTVSPSCASLQSICSSSASHHSRHSRHSRHSLCTHPARPMALTARRPRSPSPPRTQPLSRLRPPPPAGPPPRSGPPGAGTSPAAGPPGTSGPPRAAPAGCGSRINEPAGPRSHGVGRGESGSTHLGPAPVVAAHRPLGLHAHAAATIEGRKRHHAARVAVTRGVDSALLPLSAAQESAGERGGCERVWDA
jgi:hypothetical protein